MRYLHQSEPCIAHGDLKGSNIIVTCVAGEEVPKLLDFGLARILKGSAKLFGGTLRYMAPEVMHETTLPTSAADIYSFGRLCFLVAIGQEPLTGCSERKIREISRRSVPQLSWQHQHGTSKFAELCNAIADQCLQFEPEMRPKASEIHRNISMWCDSLGFVGSSTQYDLLCLCARAPDTHNGLSMLEFHAGIENVRRMHARAGEMNAESPNGAMGNRYEECNNSSMGPGQVGSSYMSGAAGKIFSSEEDSGGEGMIPSISGKMLSL